MHLGEGAPRGVWGGGGCKGLAAAKLCHTGRCRSHLIPSTYALSLAILARGRNAVWEVEGSKQMVTHISWIVFR